MDSLCARIISNIGYTNVLTIIASAVPEPARRSEMNPFDPARWTAPPATQDADPLAAYRAGATYRFPLVAMLFLVPYGINNLVHGRHLQAVLVFIIVLAFGIDAMALRRGKPAPVRSAVFLLAGILAIGHSTSDIGFAGALWSYPCVLFVYFATPRRRANVWAVILLLSMTAIIYEKTGSGEALRFALPLLVTIVATHIILNVIRDLERRLVEQATTDPLTGAFNRRHLAARLEEAMERQRRKATPAALLLIDIDHFKQVNDRYGHEAGDDVLKKMVSLIRDRCRALDSLFRIGGEEFLLLLADASAANALHVAEELRVTIGRHRVLPDMPVTVSIGVSEIRLGETSEAWMRRADTALYEAKNAGRNCVRPMPAGGHSSR